MQVLWADSDHCPNLYKSAFQISGAASPGWPNPCGHSGYGLTTPHGWLEDVPMQCPLGKPVWVPVPALG